MTNKWIKGDLDDMIFADCDWQPSERLDGSPNKAPRLSVDIFFAEAPSGALFFYRPAAGSFSRYGR